MDCLDSRPAEALTHYLEALSHDPHNDNWHHQVALLYEQQGNTSRAIEHLRLAGQLKKYNQLPHHKKALRVSPLYFSHSFKYYSTEPVEAYKYENAQNKKSCLPLYRKVATVLAFVFSSLFLSAGEVSDSREAQEVSLFASHEPSGPLGTCPNQEPMVAGQAAPALYQATPPPDSTAYGEGLLITPPPDNYPVAFARIILNYTGNKSNTTDTVYTGPDGQFYFENMTVYQGVSEPNEKWGMTHIFTFPNPGAAINIYQMVGDDIDDNRHASIYDMYGRLVEEIPVTRLATLATAWNGNTDVVYAHWDGRNKPQGIYVYQFDGKTTKIVHDPNGTVACRDHIPSKRIIDEVTLRGVTARATSEENYMFTISSTDSSNIQLAPTQVSVELVEGYNNIEVEATPQAYRYFASGESNANSGWLGFVKSDNEQDTVFKSFLSDGGYHTDTVFLEGQSTQMRVVGEADGFRPLDELVSMSWDGMVVNPQFQDDTISYSLSGSAGPNGESLVFLHDDDTLGMASISDESYAFSFSRFWQDSVSNVQVQSMQSTLVDTVVGVSSGANSIDLPVYDQVLEYSISGSAGPNEDTLRVIADGDTVQSIISDNEYSTVFNKFWQENVDSVRMKSSYVDTVVGVSVGNNTVDLPVFSDSLAYVISGSAGPNGSNVAIVTTNDNTDTLSQTMVENQEYETSFKRNWLEGVDSVRITSTNNSLVDTVVNVQEGENTVNLPAYMNTDIAGYLKRHTYPYQGNLENIQGFITFEGLNINYEDSIQTNNYGLYQLNDLLIPPSGTAQYKVTITPTLQLFMDYVDTISVTPSSEQIDFTVLGWPQYTHLHGNIRDLYSDQSLDGVTVRFVDLNADTILAQTTTDADGNYMLPAVEKDHVGKWEVGYLDTAQGYMADVGNEMTIEQTLANESYVTCAEDTSYKVNWTLVPSEIPIPTTENDPNNGETLAIDQIFDDQIEEMIRGPPNAYALTDTEEAMGRQVRLNYNAMTPNDKQDFENFVIRAGDSLFYGIPKSVAINDASRPFELVNETIYDGSISDYHPVTHIFEDSLGYNVSAGPNTTYSGQTEINNNKTYQEFAKNRGDITCSWGDQAGAIKEIYGRSEDLGNVSITSSFMNINAADPTLADRAIVYLIHKDNEKRWQQDDMQTYYPKKNVTLNMPVR